MAFGFREVSAYTAFETFSAYTEIDCYSCRNAYFISTFVLDSYITARIGGEIGLIKVLTYFSADFRVVLLLLLLPPFCFFDFIYSTHHWVAIDNTAIISGHHHAYKVFSSIEGRTYYVM